MPEEPQIVGEARDYMELIDHLRAWFRELQVTSLSVDAYAGVADGFFNKAVAAMPIKSLGRRSLGPILGALGLKLILAVDPPALEKARQRLVQSKFPGRCHTDSVLIRLSEAHMRKIRRKGGQNSRKFMSPEAVREMHSRIGKVGAAARWAARRKPAA
jgi:hypothetical protein